MSFILCLLAVAIQLPVESTSNASAPPAESTPVIRARSNAQAEFSPGTRSSGQFTLRLVPIRAAGEIDWPSRSPEQLKVGQQIVIIVQGLNENNERIEGNQLMRVDGVIVLGGQVNVVGRMLDDRGETIGLAAADGLIVQPQIDGYHAYYARKIYLEPVKND